MKVTLIVPTLNEIHGIQQIMPRIKPEWYDQLIVIDGGSTDGTVKYMNEQGYCVVAQQQKGMRQAYLETLPHVEGDIIITFSPDGNSIPELIPQLVQKMKEGYDMIIVSRYAGNAKSYDDNLLTGLANKMFNVVTNILFRARYTDAMVIYRAYKRELIETLDLHKESSYWLAEKIGWTTMSWELLLSIRCAKRKLKVGEIPGDEPPRIGGPSRVHWRWGFAYLVQMFRESVAWR